VSAQQHDSRVLPPWWIVTRDVALFVAGLVLVFWEVSRPEIRDAVLILGGSLLGGPSAALGATSLAQAIASRGGTASPSSSPAADPAPPSSSSPASGA
jgi:hypothetical protein